MSRSLSLFALVATLANMARSAPLPSKFDLTLPTTIRDYFRQRDTLLDDEKIFENRIWTLTEDEIIVDRFFHYLKWRDMSSSMTIGFPSSRQIKDVLPEIQKSELYQHLTKLPKGGNLHSHENQQLSKRILLDIIWSSKDFGNLFIIKPINDSHPKNQYHLDFFINPPLNKGWVRLNETGYSKEFILKKINFIDSWPVTSKDAGTNSGLRWKYFNEYVDRAGSNIINNIEVKKKYFMALYNESLKEGIIYLETRRTYSESSLYELDPSGASNATNGKRYLNNATNFDKEIGLVLDSLKQFQRINPNFVGHKTIATAVRRKTQDEFEKTLNISMDLTAKYPNHVIGFDNVGEEDAGFSTLKFINGYIRDFQGGRARVPLYLHSVETNWPDDLMPSEADGDLVPTLENAYEAILLQPKRIGHGKGFAKTPYLRQLMKERKIAVEACLISNQILGYDPDLRNHFGQYFYREGIPVVLAPDDPGTLGYDGVTMDWYAAFISWGLNLGDLKKFALTSLYYSGMNDTEKKYAIENVWNPSWNEYVRKMKDIACSRDYVAEANKELRIVTVITAQPSSGPPGTKVHIFGRNFELAICYKPKCKFDDLEVDAVYLSQRHLICVAPPCAECNGQTVNLNVALDENYQTSTVTFTYNGVGIGSKIGSPNECVARVLLLSFFILLIS